jgi:hypothetical protein
LVQEDDTCTYDGLNVHNIYREEGERGGEGENVEYYYYY